MVHTVRLGSEYCTVIATRTFIGPLVMYVHCKQRSLFVLVMYVHRRETQTSLKMKII